MNYELNKKIEKLELSSLLGINFNESCPKEYCFIKSPIYDKYENKAAGKAFHELKLGESKYFDTFVAEQRESAYWKVMKNAKYVFAFIVLKNNNNKTISKFCKAYKINCIMKSGEAKIHNLIPEDYERKILCNEETYKHIPDDMPFFMLKPFSTPGKVENKLLVKFKSNQCNALYWEKFLAYDAYLLENICEVQHG